MMKRSSGAREMIPNQEEKRVEGGDVRAGDEEAEADDAPRRGRNVDKDDRILPSPSPRDLPPAPPPPPKKGGLVLSVENVYFSDHEQCRREWQTELRHYFKRNSSCKFYGCS